MRIDEHFDSFQQVYDERFQAKYGFWRPIVGRSVAAFLKRGLQGFARVRCPDCQHEMFVAYSCKQPTGTETCFGRLRDGARLPILPPETHVIDWHPSTIALVPAEDVCLPIVSFIDPPQNEVIEKGGRRWPWPPSASFFP